MYNQLAESFSSGRRVAADMLSPISGWSRFDQLFCEVADATPCEASFRASLLIGELPSIAHFAPRTQVDIVRVVVRDMVSLRAPADGLVRVKGGVYRWRFAERE